MDEKNWIENYQQMIDEKEDDLKKYISLVEDLVFKGIISEYKLIEWGEVVKGMRDEIEYHKELMQKFKNQTEDE